jgi:hypothetical protein
MHKKSVFLVLSVFLFLIMFSSFSFAYTVTTVGGSAGYGPYQTGQGGEFTLDPGVGLEWLLNGYSSAQGTRNAGTTGSAVGIDDDTFQTFCLEKNEYIYPNTTFNVTISNAASSGGGDDGNSTSGSDPLSIGAAYLYYMFATGQLDYDYQVSTRTNDAATLQAAFWALEDETSPDPTGNEYYNLAVGLFGAGNGGAERDNNGAYGVSVLNMFKLDGSYAQDQLVLTPTPIPGALLLLGSGLIGLVGIRRRMKR